MCREKPENCLVTEFLTAQLTDFGTSRAKVREEEEEESVLMTGVGTPLFAAPEVMMGEYYDESIDVYSFAIVLLVITMDDDPASWFLERFKQTHPSFEAKKKTGKRPRIMKVLRAVWEEGWRPYDTLQSEDSDPSSPARGKGGDDDNNPLSFAPSSVRSLIVRCGSQDAKARPTFEQIMEELEGTVAAEVTRGAPCARDPRRRLLFLRHPHEEVPGSSIIPGVNESGHHHRPSLGGPSPSLEETYSGPSAFSQSNVATVPGDVLMRMSENPIHSHQDAIGASEQPFKDEEGGMCI